MSSKKKAGKKYKLKTHKATAKRVPRYRDWQSDAHEDR